VGLSAEVLLADSTVDSGEAYFLLSQKRAAVIARSSFSGKVTGALWEKEITEDICCGE
jgi:hypothetical protein